MSKRWWIFAIALFNCAFALEPGDEAAMRAVIQNYTHAWNHHEGRGFGADFAEDANFVNIFGMKFSGKAEIEERHVQILKTFLKGSTLEITRSDFREVQPGLVVALVDWKLDGFRSPGTDLSAPGGIKTGVFTHVFLKKGDHWEIIACQNTLSPH